MSETKSKTSGIGLGGIVFVVFLVLKLTHYIDWSWWWVTAPMWLPTAVIFGVAGLLFAIAGIGQSITDHLGKSK